MCCAISLASVSISVIVRLPAMLENTDVGTVTPTVAQTSLTTDSSVMSGRLLGCVHRHTFEGLAGHGALRSAAGVGGDVFAQRLVGHVLELGLLALLGG